MEGADRPEVPGLFSELRYDAAITVYGRCSIPATGFSNSDTLAPCDQQSGFTFQEVPPHGVGYLVALEHADQCEWGRKCKSHGATLDTL